VGVASSGFGEAGASKKANKNLKKRIILSKSSFTLHAARAFRPFRLLCKNPQKISAPGGPSEFGKKNA
jgi:hypothetical protein